METVGCSFLLLNLSHGLTVHLLYKLLHIYSEIFQCNKVDKSTSETFSKVFVLFFFFHSFYGFNIIICCMSCRCLF